MTFAIAGPGGIPEGTPHDPGRISVQILKLVGNAYVPTGETIEAIAPPWPIAPGMAVILDQVGDGWRIVSTDF